MLRRVLFQILVATAAVLVLACGLTWGLSAVAWRRYRVWAALPVENALSESRFGWNRQEPKVGRSSALLDPWGRPWSDGPPPTGWGRRRVWSNGPNGIDEKGEGDDVPVDGSMELVALAPLLAVPPALLLLWLAVVVRCLGGPRGPEAWHDAVRAAVATTPALPVVVFVIVVTNLTWHLPQPQGLVVPVEWAVLGAAWLVLSLVVLAWRVRRSNPRRIRVRPLRVVAACAAAVVAAGAVWHGLSTHARDQLARAERLRAHLGHRNAVVQVLDGDQPGMEAFLATGPELEWERLGWGGYQGVARLGPAANRYMALALRWDGGAAQHHDLPWRHLLAHDVDFKVLAAAVAAEPERYPGLLLDQPGLVAALVGARRTLEGLRVLAERTSFDASDDGPGLSVAEAAETRVKAIAAIDAVAGGDDVWVLVDVLGLTPVDYRLRCGVRLDDGPEREWIERPTYGRIMVALGPLPARPAGRVLHLRDLSGRERELALPALPAGTSVWVDALMRSGRLVARTIVRPR